MQGDPHQTSGLSHIPPLVTEVEHIQQKREHPLFDELSKIEKLQNELFATVTVCPATIERLCSSTLSGWASVIPTGSL
jgi:hypothetical protein